MCVCVCWCAGVSVVRAASAQKRLAQLGVLPAKKRSNPNKAEPGDKAKKRAEEKAEAKAEEKKADDAKGEEKTEAK